GQGVKVNGGTVALSASGAIALYSLRGPLDAILDITGYYVPAGNGGAPGPAGLPGAPGARGLSAWDPIPSGQTVTGTIVYDGHSAAIGESDAVSVDLPGQTTAPLTDATVSLAPVAGLIGTDATCIGSNTAPTAPSGKVCIYISTHEGVDNDIKAIPGQLPSMSFQLSFLSNVPVNDDEVVYATWAYKAP
ncbi:MAG TPA: hypothetical protein VHQ23_15815, partial [Ilumatobacteraceae bacterium]|nr:hypothetical protein [Ilumatobacteraceae bacterium]